MAARPQKCPANPSSQSVAACRGLKEFSIVGHTAGWFVSLL